MNERCLSEEVLTMVHAFPDKGRKDEVRALASRIAKLEAVVEAADRVVAISDREHDAWIAYRAAKAELEMVKG